jgi:transcriptional regulator with XRE-family HTH domain
VTPLITPYSVRVRNTDPTPRGEWGTYIRAARERRGLGQAALARLLGVDRATIYRWESKQQRPESVETVATVARLLGLDIDEALGAAGLRVGSVDAPPVEPYDEELELVRTDPNLSPAMKVRIATLIVERRERERAAALAETRRLIELMRDEAS